MKSKLSILNTALTILLFTLLGFGSRMIMQSFPSEDDTLVTQELKGSIEAFAKEHSRLPGFSDHQNFDIDLETDFPFMTLLTGKTAFYKGKDAIQNTKTKYWHSGLKMKPGGGLLDSKGNYFRIRLDADGDGKIHSPIDNEPVPGKIAIWSAGKDGKFETWRDNSKSW